MKGRIRDAWEGIAALFSPRRKEREKQTQKEVIQGSAGNVIIVKSPNTEYFKEAIFILCDDLFARRGVDRKQLMLEARRAAGLYVSRLVPPRRSRFPQYLICFMLGAAACFVCLTLVKLL